MAAWKRDVTSGLIVLVPLLITTYAIIALYRAVARVPLFRSIEVPFVRVAIILGLFIVLVFVVGYLMRTAVGTVAVEQLDGLMNRIPLLRVVYNASQLAVESALSGNPELSMPVRVTTWDGTRMTAFNTGKRTADGRLLLFLPTSPNITSGYVIEVRPEDVTPTDETVEVALTRVISAGFGDRNDGRRIPVVEERAADGADTVRITTERTGGN